MTSPWSYKDFVKDALSRVREVTCEQLRALSTTQPVYLVDVREPDEISTGVVPGAILLPRGLIERHAPEHLPATDAPIYVYCSSGNRSALAGDVLLRMGYRNVFSVAGGMERWRHLGYPVSGDAPQCLVPGRKLDWKDVRREFAIATRRVPVLGSGERSLVYLDHAASTHAPESVIRAYTEFIEREYANIHRGTHLLSRKATERFDEAYYVVADFLGAELKSGCVCFTANTTHAIDLASHVMSSRPGKVVTTEMEHHSNELPHRQRGPVLRARVNDEGELDLDHLESLLRKNDVKLVAVTAGSNVTGVMPDLGQVARLAHEHGALVLVDAAQALARHPLDVKPFDHPEHLDFVAGAGHKAYAPFGAGFLYGPRALMQEVPPYLPGGGTASQVTAAAAEFLAPPDRHQGGTPNIAGVVGLAQALQFLRAIGLAEVRAHEVSLLERLLSGLSRMGGVRVYGPPDPARRLGVVSFNVDGVSDLMTAAVLSEEGGIAVRNGRFCAHIYVDRLLRKDREAGARTPDGPVRGAVRASVGLYTDTSDIDRLLEFVQRVKDRRWRGRYRVKGDAVSADFAGRCADSWMEATQESELPATADAAQDGELEFLPLHPTEACRSYLVADRNTREAALVDPLRTRVDDYLTLLTERGYSLRYTVETHTHADHLSGSVRLKELTGAQLVMHAASGVVCVDRPVKDGDVLPLGRHRLEVIATPGHTPDGMCLLLPGRVLTGDTLLVGGCGRTDQPAGDAEALYASLRRLLALPDDTLVFPAHDYAGRKGSTLGQERRTNPKLKTGTVEEFRTALAEDTDAAPTGVAAFLASNQKCL